MEQSKKALFKQLHEAFIQQYPEHRENVEKTLAGLTRAGEELYFRKLVRASRAWICNKLQRVLAEPPHSNVLFQKLVADLIRAHPGLHLYSELLDRHKLLAVHSRGLIEGMSAVDLPDEEAIQSLKEILSTLLQNLYIHQKAIGDALNNFQHQYPRVKNDINNLRSFLYKHVLMDLRKKQVDFDTLEPNKTTISFIREVCHFLSNDLSIDILPFLRATATTDRTYLTVEVSELINKMIDARNYLDEKAKPLLPTNSSLITGFTNKILCSLSYLEAAEVAALLYTSYEHAFRDRDSFQNMWRVHGETLTIFLKKQPSYRQYIGKQIEEVLLFQKKILIRLPHSCTEELLRVYIPLVLSHADDDKSFESALSPLFRKYPNMKNHEKDLKSFYQDRAISTVQTFFDFINEIKSWRLRVSVRIKINEMYDHMKCADVKRTGLDYQEEMTFQNNEELTMLLCPSAQSEEQNIQAIALRSNRNYTGDQKIDPYGEESRGAGELRSFPWRGGGPQIPKDFFNL